MGDVTPLSHLPVPKMPPGGEKGTAGWDSAPCTVLSLRSKLFRRLFEEEWAERERILDERERVTKRVFVTPRLRLVRP
jgi:hypothetical protein